MRKLDRNLASKPLILDGFCAITKPWGKVTNKHKKKIWDKLSMFQNQLCVYCESPAKQGFSTGHIEHFYPKGYKKGLGTLYKHLMYDWRNLFGCCAFDEHCGHYKDEKPAGMNGYSRDYDVNLLIKPDIEDPEEFLQFLPSGKVEVKDQIGPQKARRAKETIKALNLQASRLILSRKSQIDLVKNQLKELEKLVGLGLDINYEKEFQSIRLHSEYAPHRTAIKQSLFQKL